MTELPSLFVSHGAPTLAVEDSPARRFLLGLGARLPRPRAIVVVSAHHDSAVTEITGGAEPETIHDFNGFPQALYELRYPAPGEPQLADDLVGMLQTSGIDARVNLQRGLDHGAWVPLMLVYPDADIPVVQVSINMSQSPRYHFELGRSLASLRQDDVLVIGSGSATHNRREFFAGDYSHDAAPPTWVTDFADWLAARVEEGQIASVLNAVEEGPHGRHNHPTMDHIHPLFVACGAAGDSGRGSRVHRSTTYGVLAMDVYAFGSTEAIERL
jgi:4,5-DOPA dioxygenase extradiol